MTQRLTNPNSSNVIELDCHPRWQKRTPVDPDKPICAINSSDDWEQRRFELIVARELAGEDFVS